MLIRTLPLLLFLGGLPACAEDSSGGEEAARGTPDPGPGEGEGEPPAPVADEGLPDLFDTPCDPAADDPCGHAEFACVRVAHIDRTGVCMQRCGPVDRGKCAVPAGCPDGFACIHVNHFPVVAVNVCSPVCADSDDPVCFVGTQACAPEVEADEELKFRCEDDGGASRYVCLP